MAEQKVLTVNGMTCDGCEERITSALGDAPGVEEASAGHKAGTVTLSVAATVAETRVVRDVIEELGYEVVPG